MLYNVHTVLEKVKNIDTVDRLRGSGMVRLEWVYGESVVHCARQGHITLTVEEQGFK